MPCLYDHVVCVYRICAGAVLVNVLVHQYAISQFSRHLTYTILTLSEAASTFVLGATRRLNFKHLYVLTVV